MNFNFGLNPGQLSTILGLAFGVGTIVHQAFPTTIYGQLAGATVAVLMNEFGGTKPPSPPAA